MTSRSTSLQAGAPEFAFPGEIRAFFGHQSVGNNILDGIRRIYPNAKIIAYDPLNTGDQQHGLFHKKIGRNGNPRSKVSEFVECLRKPATPFDVALMKFCYADINAETDVKSVFEDYQVAIDTLSSDIPGTRILHCTVPLRTVRLGARSIVKRALARPVTAIEDNRRREALNDLIRSTFCGSGSVFDLAALESTSPDGSKCATRYRSTRIPTLDPQYSNDGGHLNSKGQTHVARRFVQLINEAGR